MVAMTSGLDGADRSQPKRPLLPPTRSWRALCLAAALVVLAPAAATGTASASERAGHGHPLMRTTVLQVPAGGPEMDPSEPHIAVDPNHPRRLFAVAQVGPPENRHEFLWRTDDGGNSWTRSPLLGGTDNSPDGIGLDPVVAAGGHGLVLYGTIAGEIDAAAGTATVQAGTRVSTDGGASFTDFAARTRRHCRCASSLAPAFPLPGAGLSTSRGWPSTPPAAPSAGQRTWSGFDSSWTPASTRCWCRCPRTRAGPTGPRSCWIR